MDHVEDRIIGFEDQAEEFNNWPKKLNKSKQRSKKTQSSSMEYSRTIVYYKKNK